MNVEERVMDLLEPIVASASVDLVDIEFVSGTLRVVIDGDGGVSTERLAEVNRLIGPVLDQHDPIPGSYTLEVSSPGLERPLKRAADFRRAIGQDVIVKLAPGADPRRIKGRLAEVDDGTDGASPELAFTVEASEIDGVAVEDLDRHQLTIDQIESARTVFEWGPAPKPGGPKNKPGGSKKKSSGSKKKNAKKT